MGPITRQPNENSPVELHDTQRVRQNLLQLLGLTVKSRHAVFGAEAVMKAVRTQSAKVVFVASNAGNNSMKKYKDKCEYYQIPLIELIDRDALGQACGRPNMVAVAVTNPGFAAKLLQYAGEFDGGDAFDKTSGI